MNKELLNATLFVFGPQRTRRLLARTGDLAQVWKLTAADFVGLGIKHENARELAARKASFNVESEWKHLREENITLIAIGDSLYPPLLKETYAPPLALFVKGNSECLSCEALAVVGTRSPTSYGKSVVERIVPQLVSAGLTIVSGLAQGIDALAHEMTLNAGGATIAVLGCGLQTIFPAHNQKLGERILSNGGLIVSEYPWGVPPLKHHFPARNRIIAGLATGTLVVESRLPGGSLITAKAALEEGREVFAVPGAITNPASEGTNALIKEGAVLVRSAGDILVELNLAPNNTRGESQSREGLSVDEKKIVAMVEKEPLYIDTIIVGLEKPPPEVTVLLTSLELKGVIKNTGGNIYTLA